MPLTPTMSPTPTSSSVPATSSSTMPPPPQPPASVPIPIPIPNPDPDPAEALPPHPSSDDFALTAEDLAAVEATERDAAQKAAEEKRQREFERSLAGPSVGKAGLMRDQTEINRIIAEASKGSKFYDMQVKKDRELTEKIEWFKAKRDELVRMANMERLEAECDRIMVEVEASRDLSQTIVHVDMDAFYAAVEVQRDPSLKGKAFGVGGGVLCTASYEARKYGVRSGMAGFIAKTLCPHIILTKLHFDLYHAASTKVRNVLAEYDNNLAMAGLDEGYLNITAYMTEHGMTASEVVTKLRAQVEETTGLTISAGIAPNRMLAKICSDKNKPNGQYEMEFSREAIIKFMRDLPVRKIPGFGRVTERCLEGLGVETCGDIYKRRAELLVMDHWFSFRGLCKAHLGIADNTVEPYKREERKSVGVERTFPDKWNNDEIMQELESIAEELERDLKTLQYSGKTVTVKFKLHTFENKTRAQSVKRYINTKEDILPIAVELLRRELPVRIRLLGIRLSNLKDLTIEEKDKGIKKFFSSPQKRGSSSRATEQPLEAIDITALDDDSDEESKPRDEDEPSPAVGSPKIELDPSPSQGPMCPICNRFLHASTSNAELNEHIDLCLNRDAFGDTLSPSRKRHSSEEATGARKSSKPNSSRGKPAAKKGKHKPSPMLDWLKRSQ